MMAKQKRGQSWSVDIIFGVIVFALIIGIFYAIISSDRMGRNDELYEESKAISLKFNSESTSSSEYRFVEDGAINKEKLEDLTNKDIDEIKEELGIKNKFCIYIIDQDGNLIPINNTAGIGYSDLNLSGTPCGQEFS